MARSPRVIPLSLTPEDRAVLERWTRRRTTEQALAVRARIVLACAEPGATHVGVARALRVSRPTVATWRARFAARGREGLRDEPRPGAPRTITDAQVDAVLRTTLEEAPPSGAHWSTRSLAARLGMSQTAVSRIWRAFGLAVHPAEPSRVFRDPALVDRRGDVVGLYVAPPDGALALCLDASRPQPSDPVPPPEAGRPGQVERRVHAYVRQATSDLFAALAAASTRATTEAHRRRRSAAFRHFLDAVDQNTPARFDLHLVLAQSAIHKQAPVHAWMVRHPRVRVHITPAGASWPDLVGGWLSRQQRRALGCAVHRSTYPLEQAIREYVALANHAAQPFVWVRSTEAILASAARACQIFSNSRR